MRKPSAETQLRSALRDLKQVRGALELCKLREEQYRARATKAEQEAKDWEKRFDALLAKFDADPL